jgi:hypothetical protein
MNWSLQSGSNWHEQSLNENIILYSYTTPVAVRFRDGKTASVTKTKFSLTTSKHITQALERWGNPIVLPREQEDIGRLAGIAPAKDSPRDEWTDHLTLEPPF